MQFVDCMGTVPDTVVIDIRYSGYCTTCEMHCYTLFLFLLLSLSSGISLSSAGELGVMTVLALGSQVCTHASISRRYANMVSVSKLSLYMTNRLTSLG
jgi:hypothetical protein